MFLCRGVQEISRENSMVFSGMVLRTVPKLSYPLSTFLILLCDPIHPCSGEPYEVPEMEPILFACKASDLLAVLSLYPFLT